MEIKPVLNTLATSRIASRFCKISNLFKVHYQGSLSQYQDVVLMPVFEYHSYITYNIPHKTAESVLDILVISLAPSALDYMCSFKCMDPV